MPLEREVKSRLRDRVSPAGPTPRDGAPGWAPIHSSASGCGVGTSLPSISAMAVRDGVDQ